MATTYTAQNFPLSVQGLTDSGTGLDVTSMFSYDIATGSAFIINDVVLLAKIPVGAVVTDFLVNVPSLDSSTGVVSALGDNTGSAGAFNATYITAATGTAATTGLITGWVRYNMRSTAF